MTYSLHPLDDKLLLGRYRVVRLLGEGGMGTVHLARVEGAEGFTRPVVVKRMKRDMRISEEGNRLFIREAKILSKMQHPGIVGISDFGVEDGAHIMVLEYVHGYTLAPWLDYRHQGQLPLPVDICLYIMRRILDALQYAHRFGTDEGQEIEIVHRDISPDNVLLSNKGYVHLLDFGIASITGQKGVGATNSGTFRGKLGYAAPELVHGQPATPRSDQYSAAVLLQELLTGIRLFESDSVAETFVHMVNTLPEPASKWRPEVPSGLDEALLRALAKDPAQRFDSALAFSRELRRFQQEDDEEVAQELKRLVSEDFERLPAAVGVESLKVRETALEKILSLVPEPKGAGPRASTLVGGHAANVAIHDVAHGAVATLGAVIQGQAAPAAGEQAQAAVRAQSLPAQKQLRGLLIGLLAIGSFIAVGIGAAVALLSRGHGAEQVVVVGGERNDPSVALPVVTPAAAPSQAADPTQAQLSLPSARPKPGSGTALGKPAAPPGNAVPARNSGGDSQGLAQAVAKHSGAFQACFAQHLADTPQSSEAVLHFSVAKQGGSPQVEVEPASLGATSLGRCLKGAGRQVQFPPLAEPVAFRVPVRARVSRQKDNQ